MRWAALDFETATRSRSSACALGLIIVDDGVERYRQSWLIRPPANRYERANIGVHGITPDQTDQAPDFRTVWREAMVMIEDRPLVAHNASFDFGVVRQCCEVAELNVPQLPYHCTVRVARRAWPQLAAYRLPIVSEHIGVELNHHDALSDAAACSQIMREALAVDGSDGIASFASKHRLGEKFVHVPTRRSRTASGTRSTRS